MLAMTSSRCVEIKERIQFLFLFLPEVVAGVGAARLKLSKFVCIVIIRNHH